MNGNVKIKSVDVLRNLNELNLVMYSENDLIENLMRFYKNLMDGRLIFILKKKKVGCYVCSIGYVYGFFVNYWIMFKALGFEVEDFEVTIKTKDSAFTMVAIKKVLDYMLSEGIINETEHKVGLLQPAAYDM